MNNVYKFYQPELDGLRFIAFMLVFIHHHPFFSKIYILSIVHIKGWIGVDLFFVLSAYLLTSILINEYKKQKYINFKKFFIRRILRIWPIYIIFTLFSFITYIMLNHNIEKLDILRFIGLLSFSDNILSAFYNYNPLPFVAHLWTISYEEQFYIILPFFVYFIFKNNSKNKIFIFLSLLFLFVFIKICFIIARINHPAIWVLPITHFESIFFGIILAFNKNRLLKINNIIFGLLSLICFIFILILPDLNQISYILILNYFFIGLSMVSLLIFVKNNNMIKEFFSNKYMVFLGKRSYGLYLYHILGNYLGQCFQKYYIDSLFMNFVVSFIFTILISVISYKFIEAPFLRIKKKFEIIESRPV